MALRSKLALLFCLALCGCAQLPSSGPSRFAIDRGASDTLDTDRHSIATSYALIDIDQSVLSHMRPGGPQSLYRSFGGGRGPAPLFKLGIGDTVQVSVFEAAGGGLFSAGNTGKGPAGFISLPPQAVDAGGFILIPYAGRIRAAGRTIEQVRQSIQAALTKRAIEPQVIVAVGEQISAEVSIFGDASGNIRVRPRPSGERVLDLIARAGIRYPGHEVFVTLQRDGHQATVHFPVLLARPEENIFARPGDVLYLNRLQNKFSVFGAAGNVGLTTGLTGSFTFDSPQLFLTDAVAKAGGLLDARASPGHVYLYRVEARETLEEIGVNLKDFPVGHDLIPTIYRANFRDPSIFFTAGQFPMRDKDIIYIANADAVELDKFLSFVRLITGTAAGVASDALITRNATRALGQ